MVLTGRQMFEKDKTFARPEVQECYIDLVEQVAAASDGVFLWATLAIRSLLSAIGGYDPIHSLREHLKGIPRDFNKLYQKIFMSIDPVDRAKAFKLLLLVAGVPRFMYPLNALMVTWLRDLDDPGFPMRCEFEPYSDEEIRRRHLEAKYQLDSLTRGLLEIVDDKHDDIPLSFRKHVQFFHRTVRDFVCQSSIIQEFSTNAAYLPCQSDYARLFLAQLWFARTDDMIDEREVPRQFIDKIRDTHRSFLNRGPPAELRLDDGLLDAFGRATDHHNNESLKSPVFLGYRQFIQKPITGFTLKLMIMQIQKPWVAASYLHYLAREGFVDYIRKKVAADPDLLRPRDSMSLLLSAALGRTPQASAMTKLLLDAGASPHDLVSTKRSNPCQFTVWEIVCAALVVHIMERRYWDVCNPDSATVRRICEIIQYFFEAGAETNCFVLLTIIPPVVLGKRESPKGPTHAMPLRTLLQQIQPPNLGELLKLMKEPESPGGILGLFRSAWGYLTGKQAVIPAAGVTPSFCPEDYAPFDLSMDPYYSGEDDCVPGLKSRQSW
jgi:hypothetical protein